MHNLRECNIGKSLISCHRTIIIIIITQLINIDQLLFIDTLQTYKMNITSTNNRLQYAQHTSRNLKITQWAY